MLHAGLLDLRACTCHGVRKQVYAHALAEFAMEVAQAHQAPLVGTWDSRGDMAATGSMTAPPGKKPALVTGSQTPQAEQLHTPQGRW